MKRMALLIIAVFAFTGNIYAQENKKLTEEEALKMLEDCKARVTDLNAQIDKLTAKLDKIKADKARKEAKINELKKEINDLKAEIAKYPSEYTVVKGDYLAKIAAMRYIYNNAKAWPRIYRANRDLIKDPNLIYPGWTLKIPHGLVKNFEVIPGDYLWKIAGFSWIYNNPKMWTKIYEANKDQIKDPDLIYPGQELVIPRD